MNPLSEYFTNFDIFYGGLLGFAVIFCFFYVFTYFSIRGKFDNPHEKALEVLLPPILVGFFLNFLGFPSLIVGIIVILTYLVFTKGYLKLEFGEWITNSISLIILLTILGFLDIVLRWILFAGFLGYTIISSEKRIKDMEEKSEKKKE